MSKVAELISMIYASTMSLLNYHRPNQVKMRSFLHKTILNTILIFILGQNIPSKDELEARFQHVLASVNVNSESAGFLHNYTDEQKWKLICDHDGAIVKTSPSEFVEKLKVSYLLQLQSLLKDLF